MPKKVIENEPVKIEFDNGVSVHKRPGGMLEIHRTYGLWIFSFQRESIFQGRDEISPRSFEFYGISHMLQGNGFLWTPDGGRRSYGVGDAVFTVPKMVHDYGGKDPICMEDSLCFHGPLADSLHKSGIIRPGIVRMGTLRRLQSIFDIAAEPSRDAQIKANLLLQSLLTSVYFENKEAEPSRKTLIQSLLRLIATEPERFWTIDGMSGLCGLSESQFRRVFITETGLHPKAYVDNYKMRHAAGLLLSGASGLKDVAAAVGYQDQYHFSRRFKQVMGIAPGQYRRRMSLPDADRSV
ncbi:MAG: AraC family transcriptional regulator [Victivallales bacterium]